MITLLGRKLSVNSYCCSVAVNFLLIKAFCSEQIYSMFEMSSFCYKVYITCVYLFSPKLQITQCHKLHNLEEKLNSG